MTARVPRLIGAAPRGSVRAVALLLPGGSIRSRLRPISLVDLGLFLVRRDLRRQAQLGIAQYLLRYRFGGWYAGREDAATAHDTRWAVGEVARRHPGAPVVLVGHSLGGRAAVAAADHPAVAAVAGIAPWLPPEQDVGPLRGRRLLVIHGSADRSGAPALWSLAFAERARSAGVPVARYIVPSDGHLLLRRPLDWAAAVTVFALAGAGLIADPPWLRLGFDPRGGLAFPLPVARQILAPGSP